MEKRCVPLKKIGLNAYPTTVIKDRRDMERMGQEGSRIHSTYINEWVTKRVSNFIYLVFLNY